MDRTKLRRFEELSEELARDRLYKAEKRPTMIIINERDGAFRVDYSDGSQETITEEEAEKLRQDRKVITMRIVEDKPPERRN